MSIKEWVPLDEREEPCKVCGGLHNQPPYGYLDWLKVQYLKAWEKKHG